MTDAMYRDLESAHAYLQRLRGLVSLSSDDVFVLFSHGVYLVFLPVDDGMTMESADIVNASRFSKIEAQRMQLVSKGLEAFPFQAALSQEISRMENVLRSLNYD